MWKLKFHQSRRVVLDEVLCMACCRGLLAIGARDHIEVFDLRTLTSGKRSLRRLEGLHTNFVRRLLLPTETCLVSASSSGFVKRWDLGTGVGLWVKDFGARLVCDLALLPGGLVVVSSFHGDSWGLDLDTGDSLFAVGARSDRLTSVASLGNLSMDGRFATGSQDRAIRVWAADGALARVVGVKAEVWSLCLSPCGQTVAAGCGHGAVRLFQLPGWGDLWEASAFLASYVRSVAFSPDGALIACTGSDEDAVKILCSETGSTVLTLSGHTGRVNAAVFTRGGTKLITGGGDWTIRVWRLFFTPERRVRSLCHGLGLIEGGGSSDPFFEIMARVKRMWMGVAGVAECKAF